MWHQLESISSSAQMLNADAEQDCIAGDQHGSDGTEDMSKDEVMMWLYDMAEQMRMGLVIMPASGRIAALETAMEVLQDANAISEKPIR